MRRLCCGDHRIHRTPHAGGYHDVNRIAGDAIVTLRSFPDVALALLEIFA
jgi:hypothetical protein